MNQSPSIEQKNLYCLQICSLAYIEDVAQNLLSILPEKFRKNTNDLRIYVENFATPETLKGLSLENKYDLLGVYHKREELLSNVISLYRAPIIRYTQEFEESIEEVVHQVMIHEMAHHFSIPPFQLKKIIDARL
ncbi:MAG: metallopeptidase family protein [Proteobacteria bacterium]|nr:metallopeptidase family protein [Pseudomonadota bacterium]